MAVEGRHLYGAMANPVTRLRGWRLDDAGEAGGSAARVQPPGSGGGTVSAIGKLIVWLTWTRQCSWCGLVLHRAPFQGYDQLTKTRRIPNVTHTICPACSARVLKAYEKP